MSFTTQIFLFVFFPICLLCYYIVETMEREKHIQSVVKKMRIKDVVLIIFSGGFYIWVCFDDIFRFLIYIVCIFIAGKMIEKRRHGKFLLLIENNKGYISEASANYKKISWALPVLCFSVMGATFCLLYFKYTFILTDIWNYLFKREIVTQSYMAPLGISFITFSAISYLVDIYRVNIPVRQHRKSGRRETVCPGLRKPLMRVYSRNVLSKP